VSVVFVFKSVDNITFPRPDIFMTAGHSADNGSLLTSIQGAPPNNKLNHYVIINDSY